MDNSVEDKSNDVLESVVVVLPRTPSTSNNSLSTSKPDVLKLIGDNSKRISYDQKSLGKRATNSEVWNQFKVVFLDDHPISFVKCNKCSKIYSWKKTDGSSTLLQHVQRCIIPTKSYPKSKPESGLNFRRVVPQLTTDKLNKNIVIGLAKDIRPLNSIEGSGFKMIGQELINIGAAYGPQKIEDLLQCRDKLKKQMKTIVTDEKERIMTTLEQECKLNEGHFAITFDMWSDPYKQRPFLSVTMHYINDSFEVKHPLLGVEEFVLPSEESTGAEKSAENIRQFTRKMLTKYFAAEQLDVIMDNMTAVTDGGSNVVKVFSKRYPCMCHNLNLVLEWTFEKEQEKESSKLSTRKKREQFLQREGAGSNTEKEGIDKSTNYSRFEVPLKKIFILSRDAPKIKGSLSGVKSLVTYFKQSGLNKKLKYSLKQDVSTRWNTKLIMLKSYQKSRDEVKKLLYSQDKFDKFPKIDDKIVDALVDLLEIFKECTESFSNEKQPTIHLVAQWRKILYNHVELKDTDEVEIKSIKDQLRICMDQYLDLKDIHIAACMLDPRCKSLKFLNEDQRNLGIAFIRSLYEVSTQSSEDMIQEPEVEERGTPAAKRSRFADLHDSRKKNTRKSFDEELQIYLTAPPPDDDDNDGKFDILRYWKLTTQFSVLRKIAVKILGVPASQTSDERTFSITGITMSSRRSCLSGSTVADLTFINKNL